MQRMKIRPQFWSLAALFVASSLFLAACASPLQGITGSVVTQEMEFSDFDEVDVNDAFTVEIRQGDEYRVILEIDEASASYLDVKTSGDTLQIGLRPRVNFFLLNLNSTLRAEITMPTLLGVTAHDASHVTFSGFRTDEDVSFEVADASSVEGEIISGDTKLSAADSSSIVLAGDLGDVESDATDASRITLRGTGLNGTIRAANASHIDLSDFTFEDADVKAHDASSISIDLRGTLNAEARDASHITYTGDPTVGTLDASDASSINPR